MRRPEAIYAPAPLYSPPWQQAASRTAARPVSLRREWPEYPDARFITCAGLIALGLLFSLLGLGGLFAPGGVMESVTQAHIPQLAADLVGYSADETRALLGPPTLVRREPPAEIWQYREGECVLDVYLYGTNQPNAVQHAEIRPHQASAGDSPEFDRACLRSLRLASTN